MYSNCLLFPQKNATVQKNRKRQIYKILVFNAVDYFNFALKLNCVCTTDCCEKTYHKNVHNYKFFKSALESK